MIAPERLVIDGIEYLIRPGRASDHSFVVESWVMSYRHQSRAKDAGRSYLRGHKRLVRGLLERTPLRVACLAEDDDVIVGWACLVEGDMPLVHYGFVKEAFRGKGIARALFANVLDKPLGVYTHRCWRMSVVPMTWTYDPYAVFAEHRPVGYVERSERTA